MRKKGIVKEESVHLRKWPKADKKKINNILEKRNENGLRVKEIGLAERDKNKIGLRWPLSKVSVYVKGIDNYEILEDIIKTQLNVKKVEFKSPASKAVELAVELDTEITPELEAEGYARELSRQVQAFRKKLRLQKKNQIELPIITKKNFRKILKTRENFIKERTNAKKIFLSSHHKETFKNKTDFSIKDKRGEIGIIVTDR